MPDLGPVSQALRAELLQEVNRQGIVVWLDKDAAYTKFVGSLAKQHDELHPAEAYAWELRLEHEIKPDFTIDEAGSDDSRAHLLAEHAQEGEEIRANETKCRERKAARQAGQIELPALKQADGLEPEALE